MMTITTWDEMSDVWNTYDINIPITRDPHAINLAIGQAVTDENGDGWVVKSHSFAGPIMTIETRSEYNHLGIILVNYEVQA